MKHTIKRIWNGITTVLLSLMAVLAVLLWGVKLFGMDLFVVQSGSMEPAYHVGSLVYVKPVDPAELQAGDVITFDLGGGVRGTHRIVGVLEENGTLAFQTKGDANEEPDVNPVPSEDIIGEVIFTIPELGFLVAFIQQPPGSHIALSVLAAILLLTVLPDVLFPDRPEPKKQEDT